MFDWLQERSLTYLGGPPRLSSSLLSFSQTPSQLHLTTRQPRIFPRRIKWDSVKSIEATPSSNTQKRVLWYSVQSHLTSWSCWACCCCWRCPGCSPWSSCSARSAAAPPLSLTLTSHMISALAPVKVILTLNRPGQNLIRSSNLQEQYFPYLPSTIVWGWDFQMINYILFSKNNTPNFQNLLTFVMLWRADRKVLNSKTE